MQILGSSLILLSFAVLLSGSGPNSDPDASGPNISAPSVVSDERSGPDRQRQSGIVSSTAEERRNNRRNSDGDDSEDEETDEEHDTDEEDEEDDTDEDHSDDDHSDDSDALGNLGPNWPSGLPGGPIKLPCVDRLHPITGANDCQANKQNCNPAFMGGIWIIVMKQECPKTCKDAGFNIFDPIYAC
ncbi:hypothetical protein DdX_12331 [Ditylenchus destructor]|uniref:ShKT domain-containing protein n=1 Tax=Ditylenchus destructor TaxID=166010 RepID=A0AAD4R3V7_9BILA|nr:hypothetical protein DdX_12331 [Ditylenchus destructor]